MYRARPENRPVRTPSLAAQQMRRRARDAWPVPTTVEEIWAQLAEIVVHETACRLKTARSLPLRPGEVFADAERRLCDCSASTARQHLFDLITRTGTATPGRTT
jgi:hypothetical protein